MRIITHLTENIYKKEITAPYLVHILFSCICKQYPPPNFSPFTLYEVAFKKNRLLTYKIYFC